MLVRGINERSERHLYALESALVGDREGKMMNEEHNVRTVKYHEDGLEKLIISGPASKRTTFALHMTGPVDKHELETVIKLISLQFECLEDDK